MFVAPGRIGTTLSPAVGFGGGGRKTNISAPPSRAVFDDASGVIFFSPVAGVEVAPPSIDEVATSTAHSSPAGVDCRDVAIASVRAASLSVVTINSFPGGRAKIGLPSGRAGTPSPVKTPKPLNPENFRALSNWGAPDIRLTRARPSPGSGQSSRNAENVRCVARTWAKAPPGSNTSRARNASRASPACGAFGPSRATSAASGAANRSSASNDQRKRTGPSSGGAAAASPTGDIKCGASPRGAPDSTLRGSATTRKTSPSRPATRAQSHPNIIGDRPAKKRSCSMRGAAPSARDCESLCKRLAPGL